MPIYSSLYLGFDKRMLDLAATLSIRNVSAKHAIVIHSAKHLDSDGRELIQWQDRAGGPGANFLVEWSCAEDVDEPVIEAVMIGQDGKAGISFVSPGRVLRKAGSQP